MSETETKIEVIDKTEKPKPTSAWMKKMLDDFREHFELPDELTAKMSMTSVVLAYDEDIRAMATANKMAGLSDGEVDLQEEMRRYYEEILWYATRICEERSKKKNG